MSCWWGDFQTNVRIDLYVGRSGAPLISISTRQLTRKTCQIWLGASFFVRTPFRWCLKEHQKDNQHFAGSPNKQTHSHMLSHNTVSLWVGRVDHGPLNRDCTQGSQEFLLRNHDHDHDHGPHTHTHRFSAFLSIDLESAGPTLDVACQARRQGLSHCPSFGAPR